MHRFAEALNFYQQGKSGEARALCARILKHAPHSPQVLALHGAACAMLGQRDEAMISLKHALRFNPHHAPTHYMLGNMQRESAQWQAAITSYQQALSYQPAFIEAWINLGLTHHESGSKDEAIVCYQRALVINPMHPLALYNLGNALQQMGRHGEAVSSYEQALMIRPNDADIIFNLANALLAAGQLPRAIDYYFHAKQLRPDHAPTLANLGVAQCRIGRYQEALASLQQALLLDPINSLALLTMGNVQYELGDTDSAIASLQRAAQLDPENSDAFFNLGNVLHRSKRLEEACASYLRACELKPNHATYLGALTGTQMALWDASGMNKSWQHLMSVWDEGHAVPIDMVLERSDDPLLQLQCASKHADGLLGKFMPDDSVTATAVITTDARYRIAYLSPDFGNHPVGLSLVEVLERSDRSRFEIIGLSLRQHPDSQVRTRLIAACDQFHEIGELDIERCIQFMRDLQLDMLVDLAGYTADSRPLCLAARPARVQVGYLGFPGTMGASWLDYVIADRYVVADADVDQYAENIAWLPDCFFPSDTTLDIASVSVTRAAEGLPEDAFVFCSFNTAKRISPQMMQTWLAILAEVKNSVLWLQQPNNVAASNLRAMAREYQIDPDRLVFARFVENRAEHVARHRLADLYLDTFPYNSHSTARDALYAGLPVLTCSGRSFASRVAGSLLTTLQLPELITVDFEQYQRAAVGLALQPDRLQAIRTRLAMKLQQSPLFDSTRLAQNLERTYMAMIERARSGQSAAHLQVLPTDVVWR